MTSTLLLEPLNTQERADYGQARVRDAAFDAVQRLWKIRKAAGMTQADLAAKLGKDPAWVSRNMTGPRNWTFKTFGALIEALEGEVEIVAFGKDEPVSEAPNFRAYAKT